MYTQEQVAMAFRAGFIEAAKWPSVCVQDADSDAVYEASDAYAATLKAAQGGVTEAMYRGASQAWIDRAELDFPARLLAALHAALCAHEPETPCSLNEALAVIEAWADQGYTLGSDDVPRLRALTDRIAPEPAAQGEEGFDARKYVRHMADVLEAGGDLFKVDADLLRLAAAINKAANTAPPAQPAERVPEVVLGYFSRDDAEKLLKRKGEERINFSHIEVWNRQSEFYPVALTASPAPSEGGKGVL